MKQMDSTKIDEDIKEKKHMSEKNPGSYSLRKHLLQSNNSEYFDKFRFKSDQLDDEDSRKDPKFETMNKFSLQTPGETRGENFEDQNDQIQ